jgi:predicted metalloprotease with PDZ domain
LSEDTLRNEDSFKLGMDVLPHEIVHSWNGKYRRPADVATPGFQQPMKTELLWVYEGLTTYLGDVLTTRSGIVTEEWAKQGIAFDAAMLDNLHGRQWRSLEDTAVAAQLLYGSGRAGRSRRRGVDFYPEGKLVWLEADVVIRQKTAGKKSLDDFCKLFFGGESGEPTVVPYTYDDLVAALNKIAEHDWKEFFRARVTALNKRAPMGGIEGGGWEVAYKDQRSDVHKAVEGLHEFTDATYSLGFSFGKEGRVGDVTPDSPADRAGLPPGATIVAINGRKRSPEAFRTAIKSAKSDGAIELLIENQDFYRTVKVDYRGGEKYAVLERDESKPDLLAEIFKPRTAPPTPATAPTANK